MNEEGAKTYTMKWICGNCGSSGKEEVPYGSSARGSSICENCGVMEKRYKPIERIYLFRGLID